MISKITLVVPTYTSTLSVVKTYKILRLPSKAVFSYKLSPPNSSSYTISTYSTNIVESRFSEHLRPQERPCHISDSYHFIYNMYRHWTWSAATCRTRSRVSPC
ncbi:unnamed protein product [Chrysodeixis includens]|uniref:Uncharacterized protein n=1 Tax=Chrysodeixis includens TaxID=689277 RepID=A0A9N8PYY8_CHRIL|nr:unnamed protein product [Chrysodeixis includens]